MRKPSLSIITVLVIVGIFLVALGNINTAYAAPVNRGVDKITWCHVEPNGNQQTLELPLAALIQAGHVNAAGNPLHAGDHPGECVPPPVECPNGDYNGTEPGCGTPPVECPNGDYNGTEPGCGTPPVPPVDVCSGIEGIQPEVPSGYTKDLLGNCVPTETKPIKVPWLAECKNDCGPAIWITVSGFVPEFSNEQYATTAEGIAVISVNDDCFVTPKGCILETYHYFISKGDISFTVTDMGKTYEPYSYTGADGNTWHMLIGRTVSYDAAVDTTVTLGDHTTVWNIPAMSQDGFIVTPKTAGTPIYQAWECSLTPMYAFTFQSGGNSYAMNMPGSTDWDWMIWLMKSGQRPWPQTWPENPVKGFWKWHSEPMKDTRAWATSLKDLKNWEWLSLP